MLEQTFEFSSFGCTPLPFLMCALSVPSLFCPQIQLNSSEFCHFQLTSSSTVFFLHEYNQHSTTLLSLHSATPLTKCNGTFSVLAPNFSMVPSCPSLDKNLNLLECMESEPCSHFVPLPIYHTRYLNCPNPFPIPGY